MIFFPVFTYHSINVCDPCFGISHIKLSYAGVIIMKIEVNSGSGFHDYRQQIQQKQSSSTAFRLCQGGKDNNKHYISHYGT